MNSDQIASLVRSGLKIIAGLLAAHGMQDTAGLLNTPDVTAAVLLVVSLAWSHFTHTSPLDANSGPSSRSGGVQLLVCLCAASFLFFQAGCSSTPQQVTYQAAATSNVTVQTALQAYDQFAAAGKTTPAQNAAVKAAYEKYQATMAVVCDLGQVYAAAGTSTNSTAAKAALDTAGTNAAQELSDLVALIQSFGVKL